MEDKTSLSSNEIAAKRLIKSAAETVRRLDAAVVGLKRIEDFYKTEILALRMKLKKLCISFLESCPSSARRKAEELLWRKVVYEAVAASKSLSKEKPLSFSEKYLLENHLNYATGVLLELLSSTIRKAKQQSLPLPNIDPSILEPFFNREEDGDKNKVPTESHQELLDSVQRVLLWLGDIARYHVDFSLNRSSTVAMHYYRQAVMLNPYDGLSFNQIGTLVSSSQELTAVFYYMRSIAAPKSFPGAEANLKKLLERPVAAQQGRARNLIQRFKDLAGKLFLRTHTDAAELGRLCGAVLELVQEYLSTSEAAEFAAVGELLLQIVAVLTVCELNSKSKTSSQSSACLAFAFSLFSHMTSFLLHKLGSLVPVLPDAVTETAEADQEDADYDEEDQLGRARLRRRKISTDSSSQSESSSFELSDSDQDSDTDYESESPTEPVSKEPAEFPADLAGFLGPFEVLCTLLRLRSDAIPAAGASARDIWSNLARLLNALAPFRQPVDEKASHGALEEDWLLLGLKALEDRLKNIDFTAAGKADTAHYPLVRRIGSVVDFGDLLTTIKETGIEKRNGFYVTLQPQEKDAADEEKKEKLMHNMAHLWLKSEVQELERKLDGSSRRRKRSDLWLPYVFVVPDAAVLSHYHHLLKQIVKNKKCIVIVPTVVISELDELKKESSAARDSIRWLEDCFRTGDRFIRAQRPSEQDTIPFLTYPKRKDKELWAQFQIAECCNYFSQQHSKSYKAGTEGPSSAVLFLTGNSLGGDSKEQSIVGICSSIGVDIKEAKSLLTNRRKTSGKSKG